MAPGNHADTCRSAKKTAKYSTRHSSSGTRWLYCLIAATPHAPPVMRSRRRPTAVALQSHPCPRPAHPSLSANCQHYIACCWLLHMRGSTKWSAWRPLPPPPPPPPNSLMLLDVVGVLPQDDNTLQRAAGCRARQEIKGRQRNDQGGSQARHAQHATRRHSSPNAHTPPPPAPAMYFSVPSSARSPTASSTGVVCVWKPVMVFGRPACATVSTAVPTRTGTASILPLSSTAGRQANGQTGGWVGGKKGSRM